MRLHDMLPCVSADNFADGLRSYSESRGQAVNRVSVGVPFANLADAGIIEFSCWHSIPHNRADRRVRASSRLSPLATQDTKDRLGTHLIGSGQMSRRERGIVGVLLTQPLNLVIGQFRGGVAFARSRREAFLWQADPWNSAPSRMPVAEYLIQIIFRLGSWSEMVWSNARRCIATVEQIHVGRDRPMSKKIGNPVSAKVSRCAPIRTIKADAEESITTACPTPSFPQPAAWATLNLRPEPRLVPVTQGRDRSRGGGAHVFQVSP